MEPARLQDLLSLYLQDKLNSTEKSELSQFIEVAENKAMVTETLAKLGEVEETTVYEPGRFDPILRTVLDADRKAIDIVSKSKMGWIRWVAAAAILGFVIWSLLFVINRPFDGAQDDNLRQAQTDIKHDVKAPEVNRAMITLADGRVVAIDSLTSIDLGNVSVAKNADGEVVYSGKGGELIYNTLYNPRGSKVVSLMLSDGTKVWLNSESSLRYPIAFNGNTRPVEIVGEAYFEVAKDPNKKFIVTSNGLTTEVLGTQFNVNAYGDGGEMRVTLVEGSIAVKNDKDRKILKPGEQGQVPRLWIHSGAAPKPQDDNQRGLISVVSDVDIEEVLAWKNGFFKFNRAGIEVVMKQLERWYDLKVVYASEVPSHQFVGQMERNLSLQQVLRILEKSGVRFKVDGKTLTVL